MYAQKRRDYVWYVVMGLMVLPCIPLFGPYAFLAVFIGLFMLAFVWLVGDGGKSERIAYLEKTIARQEEARQQKPWSPSYQGRRTSQSMEDETAEVWRKVHELRARSKSGMNVPLNGLAWTKKPLRRSEPKRPRRSTAR